MRFLLPLLVVALMVSGASAQNPTGGPHDMRAFLGIDEVCVPCHTPPHSNPAHPDGLWNHALPSPAFTMYDQNFVDGVVAAVPNTASMICLSCHDGVTGVDSYGGWAQGGTTGTQNFPAGDNRNIGTNLGDDHPISIEYAYMTYHGGHGLVDPAGLLGHSSPAMVFPGGTYAGGEPYYTVECGSCHHVHATDDDLLSTDNTGSALCLACHQ